MSEVVIASYNAHKNCSEGVARIHYNMYTALSRVGIKVSLVSIIDRSFEDTFTTASVSSDLAQELYVSNGNSLLAVCKTLFQYDPPIIINGLHGLRPSFYIRFLKAIRYYKDTKVVESLFSRPYKLLNKVRYALPFTHKIFTFAPSEYAYLSSKIPSSRLKICLIPPPVDVAHFSKKNRDHSLKILGLDSLREKVIIGYVGNVFKERIDLVVLFKALSHIIPKYDVVFLCVIPPYFGGGRSKTINKLAMEFNLSNRVYVLEKFVEYRLRPFLYSSLDLMLHLYKRKEAPYPFLTILEALSTETPVITTNHNEVLWTLRGVRYPFLIDVTKSGDPFLLKSIMESCIKMLFDDSSETNVIMHNVRSRLTKVFSLESVGRIIREHLFE